ncbi:MAG: dethiobiotin synthase [Bacteroidales bacterium]
MILKNISLNIAKNKVLFISGIDTNVGKTYATAALANTLTKGGYKAITQKMVQTGCIGYSEDIEKHRELMSLPILDIDKDGTTCPIILSYPASPHLAAEIDSAKIDTAIIDKATQKLTSSYDIVLLEGAGGLMVPIYTNSNPLGGYLTIDYIKEHNYPIVLVTSGKLGSLNHTLLSIEACSNRGIKIELIIYNMYPNSDAVITKGSLDYLNTLNIPIAILEENII